MTQTTVTTWKVEVRKMNGQDTRVSHFANYRDALNYYAAKIDDLNISGDDASWPAAGAEVELEAGGRGYDYRIELLEVHGDENSNNEQDNEN